MKLFDKNDLSLEWREYDTDRHTKSYIVERDTFLINGWNEWKKRRKKMRNSL